MEAKILFAGNQSAFDEVNEHFEKGWVLNPSVYDGKPCRLENAIVYHLVRYSEEEKAQLEKEGIGPGEPKIIDVKGVSFPEVEDLIAKGFEVHQIYSKNVVLTKKLERVGNGTELIEKLMEELEGKTTEELETLKITTGAYHVYEACRKLLEKLAEQSK